MDYLLAPNRVGVYCCSFVIQLKDIEKLLQEAVSFDERENREPESYNILRFGLDRNLVPVRAPQIIEDLRRALLHLDIYRPKETPLGPWKVTKPYREGVAERDMRFLLEIFNLPRSRLSAEFFLEKDQAVLDEKNAFHIDFSVVEDILRLNTYSIKKQGIEKFEEFLTSVPIIGDRIRSSAVYQRFSSRYCYKVYPSAVIVWILDVIDDPIPGDILQYLVEAVRYYEQSEWRISIVLSAIAVEIFLAELYEEEKREQAPSDTLGSIFANLSKFVNFPHEVEEDIRAVNNARILSVHRSSMPIGEREARTSLVGATRFAHWVYFSGPFSK